jgi:hypothetical protein
MRGDNMKIVEIEMGIKKVGSKLMQGCSQSISG